MPEERSWHGRSCSVCGRPSSPLRRRSSARPRSPRSSIRCVRAGSRRPEGKRFERALEEHLGAPHVRCVSSCTAALSLGAADRRGRSGRRGPRTRDDVHRDGERGRGGRRAPGPRRQRARDRPHRPRRRGGRDHAADAGDRAGAPRGPPGRPRRPRRAARPARPHRHRGRGARDGDAVERPRDRHARQPRRLLLLRDEERHDRRGRRAGDRQPVHRARGRAPRPARAQPRRLAALRRRRLPPLRGRVARHQGEHDRPVGVDRPASAAAPGGRGRRAAPSSPPRYDALLADLPLQTPAAAGRTRASRHSWHLYSGRSWRTRPA